MNKKLIGLVAVFIIILYSVVFADTTATTPTNSGQVKIITKETPEMLEQEVNKFLKQVNNVVSIEYNAPNYSNKYNGAYTVLIWYGKE